MKRGIIWGKTIRNYTDKNDKPAVARTLDVIWDEPTALPDGQEGGKVESIFVKFDISNIPRFAYCEFEYDIVPGAKGAMAILSGIKVLGSAKLSIERPKV